MHAELVYLKMYKHFMSMGSIALIILLLGRIHLPLSKTLTEP